MRKGALANFWGSAETDLSFVGGVRNDSKQDEAAGKPGGGGCLERNEDEFDRRGESGRSFSEELRLKMMHTNYRGTDV